LARPGGNVTGVANDPGFEFYWKRYDLLKEVVTRGSKLGVLVSRPFFERTISGEKEAAKRAGFDIMFPFDELYWREGLAVAVHRTAAFEGIRP
jgi:hypothetical protein